jgi:hypothetical protein
MDIVPEFPLDDNIILLTETAKFDPDIVNKIKNQLSNGKDVMITSGLLRALEDKGIGDIAELRYTDRKSLVKEFSIGWRGTFNGDTEILIPQIAYLTNDSWELISGMDGGLGWPFLHKADYSKGTLYILTIPENFADIYNLPSEVLSEIRKTLSEDLYARLEGPARISLFLYDNHTLIVESFLDESSDISIVTGDKFGRMTDIISGESIVAEKISSDIPWMSQSGSQDVRFRISLKPHSYTVFRIQ